MNVQLDSLIAAAFEDIAPGSPQRKRAKISQANLPLSTEPLILKGRRIPCSEPYALPVMKNPSLYNKAGSFDETVAEAVLKFEENAKHMFSDSNQIWKSNRSHTQACAGYNAFTVQGTGECTSENAKRYPTAVIKRPRYEVEDSNGILAIEPLVTPLPLPFIPEGYIFTSFSERKGSKKLVLTKRELHSHLLGQEI
jgi:hypothetical protein